MSVYQLVWQEIRHRPGSFLVLVLALGIGAGAATGASAALGRFDRATEAILAAKEAELAERLDAYSESLRRSMLRLGFNLTILPEEQDPADFFAEDYATATMPSANLDILSRGGPVTVGHLIPRLRRKVLWPERSWTILIDATGEGPARPLAAAEGLDAGGVPPGSVDVGHEIHRGLGLHPGESVVLFGREFRIRACLPESGTKDDITVRMQLDDARGLLGLGGRISEILAVACRSEDPDIDAIRAEVATLLPGVRVIARENETTARARALTAARDSGERLRLQERGGRLRLRAERVRLARSVSLGTGVAAFLWASGMVLLNVRTRREEIGTWRALGVRIGRITGLFALRVVAAAVPAMALGLAPGVLLSGGSRVSDWGLVSPAVSLGMAIPVILLAAARVASADPGAVLKNET